MARMTRAVATPPSSTVRPRRSSLSAKTGGRGKRTARRQSPETKPFAPPGTMAGRSGRDGPDTMSEAGSRRKCPRRFARTGGTHRPGSRLSASASPQETRTDKPPKSGFAAPSSTASMRSAQLRSSAWHDAGGEGGHHASGMSCATTPRSGHNLRPDVLGPQRTPEPYAERRMPLPKPAPCSVQHDGRCRREGDEASTRHASFSLSAGTSEKRNGRDFPLPLHLPVSHPTNIDRLKVKPYRAQPPHRECHSPH